MTHVPDSSDNNFERETVSINNHDVELVLKKKLAKWEE
jgi:hypothetical protein